MYSRLRMAITELFLLWEISDQNYSDYGYYKSVAVIRDTAYYFLRQASNCVAR